MKTITTNVYTYDELSDKAKSNACDWYRSLNIDFDHLNICESIIESTKPTGFIIDPKSIRYTGFYSQGDGLSFDCVFDPNSTSVRQLKEPDYWPDNIQSIGLSLIDYVRKVSQDELAKVYITRQGRYCHSSTMQIDYDTTENHLWPETVVSDALLDTVLCSAKLIADYMYSQLQDGYESIQTDEYISDILIDNEYTFTSDGKRFG